jgi:hypothetical protein
MCTSERVCEHQIIEDATLCLLRLFTGRREIASAQVPLVTYFCSVLTGGFIPMLWTELLFPQNFYIKALILSGTVFVDKDFKEVKIT